MGNKTGKLAKGLVQVYTGDGKGKTTASLGLAMRAVGHDLKVYIIQFMKGSTTYGELETARRLSSWLTIEQVGQCTFVSRDNPDPVDRRMAEEGFVRAREILLSGDYDLVILDEINCAVDFGLVPLEDLKRLIQEKPVHTELVLTGRGAHPEIVDLADLVTEMRELKHYYGAGEAARIGIES